MIQVPRMMIACAALCAGFGVVAHTAQPAAGRLPREPRAHVTAARLTSQTQLRAAVVRIPGYRRHRPATFLVSTRYGSWGVTNWYANTVYISPSVPSYYLDAVVRHEWSHVLSARAYHGNVAAAVRAMNHTFGGGGSTGLHGAEVAADCMAIELGARWTHYTTCSVPAWRRAAARLLSGQELVQR